VTASWKISLPTAGRAPKDSPQLAATLQNCGRVKIDKRANKGCPATAASVSIRMRWLTSARSSASALHWRDAIWASARVAIANLP